MGNAPSPTKKRRVTFDQDIHIDRYEEDIRRFEYIMKLYRTLDGENTITKKDKLALLIVKYLERCHGDVNMTDEIRHRERVITVCAVGIETFHGIITVQQVHALQKCLVEYCLLDFSVV